MINSSDLKVPIKKGTTFTIEGQLYCVPWYMWFLPWKWKYNRMKNGTHKVYTVLSDVDKDNSMIPYREL